MTRRRLGILLVALVTAALVVVLGAAMDRHPGHGRSPLAGKPAPALHGTTLSGAHYRLTPGKVTVVNVWASWCGPCRDELPTLARVADRWASKGVRLVTIDTKDGPVAARTLLRQVHLGDLLAVQDRHGQLAVGWGATGVPETVVVDRHGIVRDRWLGAVDRDWLVGRLQRWTAS